MMEAVIGVLGAIGLLLIGMSIMTNGLKELTADTPRTGLAQFTRRPVTATATGHRESRF